MYKDINQLINLLPANPRIFIITGNLLEEELGLSTIDCQNQLDSLIIEECLSYNNLVDFPESVWTYIKREQDKVLKIKKSIIHESICKFMHSIANTTILTQNIHGVYRKFGINRNVIELYGNMFSVKPLKDFNSKNIYHWIIPYNQKGQILRPNITLYGEEIDEYKYLYASSLAAYSDLVIIMGLGNSDSFITNLPFISQENNIPIVELSITPLYGNLPQITINEPLEISIPFFINSFIEINKYKNIGQKAY